ncbi:GDPGTP exchange factor Sec2p [Penicillium bovifimosum]|uniref:GDPGTP exchange factor Sec2p n=1 Tax=Penicillium bovifimosum TaxID=126998 RepID=A0A9W9KUL6_9EURO|nr:GDPGTP exchange factor Sec2p [Penicillium bovifimosum]KAJ5121581.1 GDPGTP exchange factor Sec2p [Penicillium bovifimosum]
MLSSTTTTLVGSAMKTADKQCPMCWGEGFTQDSSGAHNRIQELEGQVHALTARASATASTKTNSAVYAPHSPKQPTIHPEAAPPLGEPTSQPTQSRPTSSESQPQTYHSRLTTLASLLPYRRGSAAPPPAPMAPNVPTTPVAATHPTSNHTSPASSDHHELQDALMREQDLRKAAESQLSQASSELEELTVQLFSQANEMVAEERKARAKLEERVAVLERRDLEKRKRLEKLENAMARVERLRALVNHH